MEGSQRSAGRVFSWPPGRSGSAGRRCGRAASPGGPPLVGVPWSYIRRDRVKRASPFAAQNCSSAGRRTDRPTERPTAGVVVPRARAFSRRLADTKTRCVAATMNRQRRLGRQLDWIVVASCLARNGYLTNKDRDTQRR